MKQKLLAVGFVLLLVSLIATSALTSILIKSPTAHAQAPPDITVKWIDYATLELNHTYPNAGTHNGSLYSGLDEQKGKYLLEDKHGNEFRLRYTLNGQDKTSDGDCVPIVVVDIGDEKALHRFLPTAEILAVELKPKNTQGAGCTTIKKERFQSIDSDNSRILFKWVDEGKIEPAGQLLPRTRAGQGEGSTIVLGTFDNMVPDPLRPGHFQEEKVIQAGLGGLLCRSYLVLPFENNVERADFFPWTGGGSESCVDDYPFAIYDIRLGNPEFSEKPAGTGQTTVNPELRAGTEETCESNAESLGWIACPIISLLDLMFNWLDSRVQELLEIDREKYRHENLREAWARMRNIAYIVLIPIMLVMVIGTALGFGFIDAYSVRRAMPRFIIAVLFISLSWVFTDFLVTLTNDVGKGVLGLMTQPFDVSGKITLNDLFTPNFGGTAVTGAVVLGGIAVSAFTPGLLGVVGSFLVTAAIIMATVFLVLTARQLFILALIVLAPIAILAWIFPGNDKLWKLWWGTFSKLLLMFPLIMAVIASGRIFAKIVGDTGAAGAEGAVLNPLLKVAAYIIPYALIPLTFRFAGGLVSNLAGMVNDRQKGMFDRLRAGRQKKYERAGRNVLQKRADWQNKWQTSASKEGRGAVSKFLLRQASRKVGGYNVQAADAARRLAVNKEINDQINTGRDDEIRGVFATDEWEYRDGIKKYKTLGGGWVSEEAAREGRRRWGRDTYAQQAALSYEMRKANTEADVQRIATGYGDIAKNKLHMSDNQAGGSWIGAAFENQNQHLEYKYTNWKDGSMSAEKAKEFATETFEKKGSYPLAQMHANTISQLKHAYDIGDDDTKQMVKGIAETFMHRYNVGGGRIAGMEGEIPIAAPVGPVPPAAGGARSRQPETPEEYMQMQTYQANTPGSAHVAENVRDLAVHVGMYRPLSPNTDIHSAGPPPETPRQS